MGMALQPSDGSGAALVSMQVISYWDAPQSELQVSVPPDTPPSGRMVAPLLTWQI
jgi:hypothetical protein